MEFTLDQQRQITDYLRQFVTPERQETIEAVLSQRTRYLTVVLENFHVTQNANAVLRTCEALGIQDLHVVEGNTSFKLHRDVTRGCNKWITLHRYGAEFPNPTVACLDTLRQQGYKLAATCPHAGAIAPEALPLDQPVAILMGREHSGLTEEALALADYHIKIPMFGFTESFNVSVSAALCLYTLVQRLHQTEIDWHLSEATQTDLRLKWYRLSARSSTELERRFVRKMGWLAVS